MEAEPKMPESKLPPVVNFAAVDFWYHNRAHSEIQLMTRISNHTKVLFVNSIGMRAPLPGRSTNSGFRIWRKLKSLLRGLRRPLSDYRQFYVFSPIIIPAYSTPWLRTVNYLLIRLQVKFAMFVLGIKKPIIIETIPTAEQVAPHLNGVLEIVNRVDKMSAFGETDQQYISSLEEKQITRSARTYYTSQELLKDEQNWHQGKGKFLDHGVDLAMFTPLNDETKRPSEISNIQKPIIGFFGGIDDYVIDLKLLESIARELPSCTLLLIGEATCDISELTNLENVKHLGYMPMDRVAEIGKYFDVAILPRKDDEWTKYTNPIKIKEYLALGLNIVTTDIPEVRRYSQDIYIAHGHDEFIQKIKEALENNLDEKRRKDLASLVQNDTWDQRCIEVIADMKELLTCAE